MKKEIYLQEIVSERWRNADIAFERVFVELQYFANQTDNGKQSAGLFIA